MQGLIKFVCAVIAAFFAAAAGKAFWDGEDIRVGALILAVAAVFALIAFAGGKKHARTPSKVGADR